MLFTDFMKKLAFTQLKNTAAVDNQDLGGIDSAHEDQLLELTNQGLIDISTRMKLFESSYALTFLANTNIYSLTSDTDVAFTDYVRLLSVHGVPRGEDAIPSNEKTFIPKTNNQITIPSPYTVRFTNAFMEDYGPEVDLKFQTKHPVITNTDTMQLPIHLYEAMALYVSGLYLSQIGGEENSKKGDSYYGLYLKMMGDDIIENKSQTSEIVDEDTRFEDRGFV